MRPIYGQLLKRLNRFRYSQKLVLDNLKQKQILTKSLGIEQLPIETTFNRNVQETKLKNDISITTVESISKITTISIFIKAGSINEKELHSGTAHFLEHMHFKGTGKRSKNQLELEIEDEGGNLNAYTTREYTSYIMQIEQNNYDWAIEILSDILLNSQYKQSYIDSEKQTINTELLECLREQDSTLLEFAHENIYRDSSIGKPILGKRENIDNVTQQMVKEFYQLNYTGENFFFLISSALNQNQIIQPIDKYFGKMKNHNKINDQELLDNIYKVPQFHTQPMIIESPVNHLHFGLHWHASNWFDRDYVAFMLLQRMLGDFERKGFHNSANHENQITQSKFIKKLESVFLPYRLTGLFGVAVQVEDGFAKNAYDLLIDQLYNYDDIVTEKDLLKAKLQIVPELQRIENGVDLTQDMGAYKIYLD